MGCWGMGMTQNDEFCEVYDDFMERYDDGKELAEISAEILSEYHKEFDDSDGVMHDVYFALAKAEWMCGALSQKILSRVTEIIESGANIEFNRELAATESDLKLRKRNLEKFLASIQTPREKPRARKRKRPPAPPKELPPVKKGECYRYKVADGYRILIVLERFPKDNYAEAVFVCVLRNTFQKEELEGIDYLNEKVGFAAYRVAEEFLSASSIRKIGEIPCDFSIKRNSVVMENNWLDKKAFKEPFSEPLEITVKQLIKFLEYYDRSQSKDFEEYEAGGVYAYEYDGSYRAFAVLDRFKYINEPEFALCAIFKNKYTSFECDFMKEDVGPVGSYTANELAALGKTEKVAQISLPKSINEKLYGNGVILSGFMMNFVKKPDGYPTKTIESIVAEAERLMKRRMVALEILTKKDLTGEEKREAIEKAMGEME